MKCDRVEQILLDGPEESGSRQEWAQAIRHAETCSACGASMAAFERVTRTLVENDPFADITPAGGYDAFAESLADTVHGAVRCQGGSGRRLFAQSAGWGLAVAAGVLLAVGVGFLAGRFGGTAAPESQVASSSGKGEHTTTVPAVAFRPPTRDEVAGGAETFQQLSEVYGDRTKWVLLSDRDAEVGVATSAVDASPSSATAPASRLLVLRLTVMRTDVVVSNADLVIIPGRTADLTVPMQDGQKIRYKISTSAEVPVKLSVQFELVTPRGGEPLGALGTELRLHPGEDVSAGRLNTTAGPYELRLAFADTPLAGGTPAPAHGDSTRGNP